MESVEEPRRLAMMMDQKELLKLECFSRMKDHPEVLLLDDILVLDALFQPRGRSLTMNPGASRKHVDQMARAVGRGAALDPLAVVAFGTQWVLIDGHHRRAAYKQAGYAKPVPVMVEDSPSTGAERVRWAIVKSVELNSKNKLPMSSDDKFDAAWRLVVEAENRLSKKELMDATGVADGTIGNMRRFGATLLAAGRRGPALRAMSWSQARFEYRRLTQDFEEADPDAYERRVRRLVMGLSGIINNRLPATMLLEAMEALKPGISVELETAIGIAKQRELADEALGV